MNSWKDFHEVAWATVKCARLANKWSGMERVSVPIFFFCLSPFAFSGERGSIYSRFLTQKLQLWWKKKKEKSENGACGEWSRPASALCCFTPSDLSAQVRQVQHPTRPSAARFVLPHLKTRFEASLWASTIGSSLQGWCKKLKTSRPIDDWSKEKEKRLHDL